jgi:predicted site-specific integrase-resolvase
MKKEKTTQRDQRAAKWLVKADELAELIGEKPRTIRIWAKNGKIPCLKFSERCTRFCPEAVRAALRRSQETVDVVPETREAEVGA